jgi:hypothetical protein
MIWIKNIFAIIIFLFLGWVVFTVYAAPEDFCYYEGTDDIYYVNQPTYMDRKVECAADAESVGIKEKNPFLYWIITKDLYIGLSMALIGGLVFFYKKKKNINN